MPIESFEWWRQQRSFASSEQDRSQGSAQNEHKSGEPENHWDPTDRKHWDTQDEYADQRERGSAYLRGPASLRGFTAYRGTPAPVNENGAQNNQRQWPRGQPDASGNGEQYQKCAEEQNDRFIQELKEFCRRKHASFWRGNIARKRTPRIIPGVPLRIYDCQGGGITDTE